MLLYPKTPGAMTDENVASLQPKQKPINQFIDQGKQSIDKTYAANVAERQSKLAMPAYQPSLGEFQQAQGVPAPTPQTWADAHTAASAEIVPPGGRSQAVGGVNLFGGGNHLDTPLLTMDRSAIPPETWAAYRGMTKAADEKLYQALASRASVPHTIDEAKQFIDSLGFDDRVGQHVDNAMTKYLQNANPELYRQMIGERTAQTANDRSYVNWARQNNPDPAYVRMTPEQIIAARTPEEDQRFQSDPNAEVYSVDPGTGKAMLSGSGKMSLRQQAEQELKFAQEQAAMSNGQLQVVWKNGKPQAASVDELQAEQQDKIDKINEAKLKRLEGQRDLISKRMDANAALLNENKNSRHLPIAIARDTKILQSIEDDIAKIHGIAPAEVGGLATPAAPAPAANEPTARLPDGTRLVIRNGAWVPMQPKPAVTSTPAPESTANLPRVGEVRKGYQYQGGDPASPKSWAPTTPAPTPPPAPIPAPTPAPTPEPVTPAPIIPAQPVASPVKTQQQILDEQNAQTLAANIAANQKGNPSLRDQANARVSQSQQQAVAVSYKKLTDGILANGRPAPGIENAGWTQVKQDLISEFNLSGMTTSQEMEQALVDKGLTLTQARRAINAAFYRQQKKV